jgi:hypothetical protein
MKLYSPHVVEVKKKKREVHRHVRINTIYISIQKKDMRSHIGYIIQCNLSLVHQKYINLLVTTNASFHEHRPVIGGESITPDSFPPASLSVGRA